MKEKGSTYLHRNIHGNLSNTNTSMSTSNKGGLFLNNFFIPLRRFRSNLNTMMMQHVVRQTMRLFRFHNGELIVRFTNTSVALRLRRKHRTKVILRKRGRFHRDFRDPKVIIVSMVHFHRIRLSNRIKKVRFLNFFGVFRNLFSVTSFGMTYTTRIMWTQVPNVGFFRLRRKGGAFRSSFLNGRLFHFTRLNCVTFSNYFQRIIRFLGPNENKKIQRKLSHKSKGGNRHGNYRRRNTYFRGRVEDSNKW